MEESTDLQDVRVVHFGLGPLGAAMARGVAEREGLITVAAIDPSPAREGHDLGEVLGLDATTGVVVDGSATRLRDIEADVVLFAPDSDRDIAISDLELLLAGIDRRLGLGHLRADHHRLRRRRRISTAFVDRNYPDHAHSQGSCVKVGSCSPGGDCLAAGLVECGFGVIDREAGTVDLICPFADQHVENPTGRTDVAEFDAKLV